MDEDASVDSSCIEVCAGGGGGAIAVFLGFFGALGAAVAGGGEESLVPGIMHFILSLAQP